MARFKSSTENIIETEMKSLGIDALCGYLVKARLGIKSGSQSQNMECTVSQNQTSSFTTWTNDLRQFSCSSIATGLL